jgi:hypothetical protein
VLMDGSWNGLVVDRILGSRPRLTDISVSRLACLRVERYITLDTGGGQGLAVFRSQSGVLSVLVRGAGCGREGLNWGSERW